MKHLLLLALISAQLYSMNQTGTKQQKPLPKKEECDELHRPWVYRARKNIYAVIAGKEMLNPEQWYFTKRVVSKAKKSQ